MNWIARMALALVMIFAATAQPEADSKPAGKLTPADFAKLMERVANGWNQGNARLAADCFSDDALYSSPPSRRMRHGQAELYEYFGGAKGRPAPMHMEWHHLAYDPESGIGFGEYTFRYKKYQAHGVVVARMRNGKIRNWREYEIPSKLDWDGFVGSNRF